MSKATLAGWYNSSAWDEPESPPSFPDAPIPFEYLQAWIESEFDIDSDAASDVVDLWLETMFKSGCKPTWIFGHNYKSLAISARAIARKNRKSAARQRLCRIIAMQYTRAVIEGDIDECDRLADALALATRDWCNG